nr:hypothetical protein [uncultured Duganella sp.]
MHSNYKPLPVGAPGAGMPRRAALSILATLALSPWNTHAAVEPMVYRYWDWGKTPKRDQYQFAVLELALQKTLPAYGPFEIARIYDTMSTSRLRREIHTGKRLNIHAGPWRDMDAEDPLESSHMIGTTVLGGLLGCRQLIVRRDELDKFTAVGSPAQLKKLVAGQGRGWVDVEILRHNGYPVVDSGNIETLLDMLASQRFDYLPISMVEADFLLKEHARLAQNLALVPGMMLYYPLPTVFYVSINEPALARRVEEGLAMAKRDGSLDALTARHFKQEIALVKASASRCFILAHPTLPKKYTTEPMPHLAR